MSINTISGHLLGILMTLIAGAFCICEYREQLHWADYANAESYAEKEFVVEARLACRNAHLSAVHEQARKYVSEENAYYTHVADSLAIVFDQAFAALNQLNSNRLEDYLNILEKDFLLGNDELIRYKNPIHKEIVALLNLISKSSFSDQNTEMKRIAFGYLSILEDLVLVYLESRVSGSIICDWDIFTPQAVQTTLYPMPGELTIYEFILWGSSHYFPNIVGISLDGKPLTIKDGYATIQKRFDRPGLHPLTAAVHWKNEMSDSVRVAEKTFYVRVRP